MSLTYKNPVWSGYFADPFVLKWQGAYYAYGTGPVPDSQERAFPMLYSQDFAHWEYRGGALEALPGQSEVEYWAPEVAERNGLFYMYYAAQCRLRVAIANHPSGPFRDTGCLIFPDLEFSIDAHPFKDPKDGRWYLFFARDFFDGRVGTGIEVVPLQDDMLTPAGPPHLVCRASADWQIYERNRLFYGKTWDAWHTVEGPFVVLHDGRYYCFYSAGSWMTPGYGVGFCVADHPLGPYRDDKAAQGATVLRTIPGKVLGPGHNSVVLGPDNRTEYIVYHAWDMEQTARRICIDPLEWTPQGPRCAGLTAYT